MNMESLYSTIIAAVMSIASFLGIGDNVQQQPVTLTPEVQTAIHQAVSDEIQDAMTLYVAESQQGPIFGTSLPIAGSPYTLAGSGVSNSATSITLSSLTVTQNGHEILDAELSDTFYITLEPGNKTKQEIVSCTTVTQNANNTATLSGCVRGLSPITPYTADSTLKFSHGGGSQVIFSNPPQFYNEFANLGDDETITGQWTFSTFPITPSNSACTTTVAGVCELATQAETAAGTTLGGSGGNLVIANTNATSTYATTTAPSRVIVTRTNGTIDPKFFATTTLTLYPGMSMFTFGTSTVTGSVTMSGGNSNSNIASTTVVASTTSGTWRKTSFPNLRYLIVEVVGGGGGGGNTAGGGGGANSSSGGGGGGYCKKVIPVAALGATETLTVGAAVGAEVAGNTSSFGSHCSATGGGAGNSTAPGAGGSGSGGDINITGQGGDATSGTVGGGLGGSSGLGFGGGGKGGRLEGGGAGGQYGGGGGGSQTTSGGSGSTGGGGAAGVVILTSVFF